ncbi:MAG TPA: squalene synthase HpnC [Gammaproteobacteria bacterium]|nr:squalene synthase HpnC [Gammaproteobacteria bacterium]HQZ87681.1 squalene synthase HpnC [Gammaproteobacteria bacterium]HRA42269.1 squalene synthase HpnC [Gammaproteobacteria bacterium]
MSTKRAANTFLENAYQKCEILALTHYENFPVASRFLPKKIRRPIAVIYAFAREADDIADEGDFTIASRLEQLEHYEKNLEKITQGIVPSHPVFIALNDVLKKHPTLPISLFFNLLTAFKQDVIKKEYNDFEEVLNYCKYSANPVGRLLLYLTNNASTENLSYSDDICTALQLINFLQDLDSDLTLRDRCYLPIDEMHAMHISKEDFKTHQQSAAMQNFIITQLLRTERLLQNGSPLGKNLSGLFGFEIRIIINAANTIVQQLKKRRCIYDRPTLKRWHWPKVLLTALK